MSHIPSRKGSFSYSPYRSRVQTRWSGLLLCVFILLFLFFRTNISFWILPQPLQPTLQASCPASPPYPSLVSQPRGKFNWRNVTQRYPVETLAQLPGRKNEKLPRVQFTKDEDGPPLYHELMRKRRQAAVKMTFERCWSAYKMYAWKQDELMPIFGRSKTTFGGWGATLVDSLDTLWIMDMKDEFNEAVAAVTEIDFAPGHGELNMFETTIRYLGGLLAAYDLTDCKEQRLLDKAMELGDMIYASFDTPNRMPITRWSAQKAAAGEEQHAASQGIIAELASFSLEFTRLSQLTGDMRYYDAVTRVTNVLAAQQNATKLPGLWPVGVNLEKPDLTRDTLFSLGAMADSAYEYLGKTYQLLHGIGNASAQYKAMYTSAMDAVTKHLLFRPMTPENADILMPTSARVRPDGAVIRDSTAQHLVCFTGGMFALGSRLFSDPTHLATARKVTDACVHAYLHAPFGIMPESARLAACPSHAPCPYNASTPPQQYPGVVHVEDARYMLRPEAIESVFYMYRVSGDRAYQDVAWDMFQAVERHSRTPIASAAIRDVTRGVRGAAGDGLELELEKEDSMESFWLAETLKYFFLVFSEPEVLPLDDWVFSTEAHPFRLG